MKVTYHPEVDVMRILFSNAPIEESDEEKPRVILDFDKDGNVVGMEILDASTRMENPCSVEYVVAIPPTAASLVEQQQGIKTKSVAVAEGKEEYGAKQREG